MLDPSCPDITARSLEALGQYGVTVGHPQVDRGIEFIAKTQDPRGCWIGRWGVNYLYGTWQVLQGLEASGFDMQKPMVRDAVAWLKKVQQPCGGWGESCQSYDDPSTAGQGEVTASQTAWALLGLIAAGEASSDEVERGIRYLLERQEDDGNWREEQFTGTGFPKVFYLKYHMYRLYFLMIAHGATSVRRRSIQWPVRRTGRLACRLNVRTPRAGPPERPNGVSSSRFPQPHHRHDRHIAKKNHAANAASLVLMLEPLRVQFDVHGCGRIREYEDTIKQS